VNPSAATESIHHQPKSAVAPTPTNRIHDRYAQTIERDQSETNALLQTRPIRFFVVARTGIKILEAAAIASPSALGSGLDLVISDTIEATTM
jgi:hypothetical protein